jgi:hypothetical protein
MRSLRSALLSAAAAGLALAGCDESRPVEQRADANACATCHGFPPPPGVFELNVVHPQGQACQVCHPQTVVSGTELVPGGPHMNNAIEVGFHPVPYPTHPIDALQGLQACAWCHGSDFNGGIVGATGSCNACHGSLGFADWTANCTFCHGARTAGWTADRLPLAAPPAAVPRIVDGSHVHETDPAFRGVGAHAAHVNAGTFANALACTECHPSVADLSHVNQRVEVAFGPLASAGTTPVWDGTTCANACHGATLPGASARPRPAWAPPSAVACGSCHEADPTTGKHPAVTPQHGFQCSVCHGGTYTGTAVDKALHVNGALDRAPITGWNAANRTCTAACHSDSARPW